MTITLSQLYTDHGIFPREKPIRIWGRVSPPGEVRVRLEGPDLRVGSALAEEDGSFEVVLAPVAAGGPYTLMLTCGNESVTATDLWAGDIWIAGGQSNMELTMEWIRATVQWELRDQKMLWVNDPNQTSPADPSVVGDYPPVRQFFVPAAYDFTGPCDEFATKGADGLTFPKHALRWVTTAELETFSAVAYFFARRIAKEQGIPVGIVATAVGGTPARAWTASRDLEPWRDEVRRLREVAQPGYVEGVISSDFRALARYNRAINAADLGLNELWQDPGFDDSAWETRTLDDDWGGDDPLGTHAGVVWLRAVIDVPTNCAGPATLSLGQVADADRVYINGRFIGGSTYRYLNREYSITLPAGRVVIAIRISVFSDDGGVTPGVFRILHTPRRDWDLSALNWRVRRGATVENLPVTTNFTYEPAGLYNAMISPLAKISPTGVIWYQGESDATQAETYSSRFAAVVDSWRRLWPELPFLWVELAHWAPAPDKRDVWAALRRAQREALSIPATAMVAAEGLGDANDLHPRAKCEVGERLAWAGLEVVYGLDLGFSPFVLRGAPASS